MANGGVFAARCLRSGIGAIFFVGLAGCDGEKPAEKAVVEQSSSKRQVSRRADREVTRSQRVSRRVYDPDSVEYQRELARRTKALGGPNALPHLTDPFQPEEFKAKLENYRTALLEGGDVKFRQTRDIVDGIRRLTADGRREVETDLQDPVFRSQERLLPYLLAYDFQVTGQPEALDQLHELHRKVGSGDSDSLAALALVDDWEETAAVMCGPGMNYDGAGGGALRIFMKIRRALFPERYEQFKEVIARPN